MLPVSRNLFLTIEYQSQVADNFGDAPEQWTELRREWFDVSPLTGREYEEAAKLESAVTHKAECAYFAGATSALRLVSGDGRTFHVENVVNEHEANRRLVWRLVEVQANG